MTAKAIEAGARAINSRWKVFGGFRCTAEELSKACIEAAIASGELVPASAVAAERERCAIACKAIATQAEKQLENINDPPESKACQTFAAIANTADDCAETIRALEPAGGEYVLVPREATIGMFRALTSWAAETDEGKSFAAKWAAGSFAEDYRAMLNAATSNGSGK